MSKDRTGRDFILPLTHEETVTFHAREIQSYRELPQLWYHFQTKDRDEPRPRGGLLRVREFIMKDAYSFDRDEEGVRASFEANREAYKKIFARCDAGDVRRPGGERDHGRQVQHRLPGAVGLGREHARPLRERRLRGRPRGGGGGSERRRAARAARRARGDRDARGDDDRRAGRVPRDRPVGDLEGDAGRQAGRHRRARTRPRRRPAQRDEALRRAARRIAPGDGRRDQRRVRRGRRLARPGRVLRRGDRRRDAARRAVRRRRKPRRAAPARGRGGPRLRAEVRRPARAARRRPLPVVRRCAHLPDRDRGRPHLQLRHLLLRAARRNVPRRGRSGEAAARRQLRHRARPRHGRDRRAAQRRVRDHRWPASVAPYDVHVVALAAGSPEVAGNRRRDHEPLSRRPAARSCSTTATSAPARSSPTPISSAARFG